ncbi:MAG: glycosyltransferase family 1 protein [Candidatus Edwardsbacteria bacterium]|nr:glycosyltransferase family 1 protein [Candidatus Edwardsbacteria bacterium]
MNAAYDTHVFSGQRFGGISRYFIEVMLQLRTMGIAIQLPTYYGQNEYIARDDGLRSRQMAMPYPSVRNYMRALFGGPCVHRDYNKVNRRLSLAWLEENRGRYDLFHPTYHDSYFLSAIGDTPFVLTIHDMFQETYPEYSIQDPLLFDKALLVGKATHIVADSEYTRKELVVRLNVPDDRVTVVYPGVSVERWVGPLPDGMHLQGRYLLYVGRRSNYKNFYFMCSALQPFLSGRDAIKLICVSGAFTNTERKYFTGLGIEKNVISMAPDDDLLSALYTNAEMTIVPSLYEGFSLPIAEAHRCGCPVVASDASCHPEIAGNAAVFFNPKDHAGLRDAVGGLLRDKGRRSELAEMGRARSMRYTWEAAAQQMREVYSTVVLCRGTKPHA